MFFSAFCEDVGKEVLLSSDNFLDLIHGPLGFEVHYRCHCGATGVVYPQSGITARCQRRVAPPSMLIT
jgi:hypothetical protein